MDLWAHSTAQESHARRLTLFISFGGFVALDSFLVVDGRVRAAEHHYAVVHAVRFLRALVEHVAVLGMSAESSWADEPGLAFIDWRAVS